MVLLCLRCQKNKEKPSRGEVVVGLSAHIPHDTQNGPILIPAKNDFKTASEIVLKLSFIFGRFWEAKGALKWSPNGTKIDPKFGLVLS